MITVGHLSLIVHNLARTGPGVWLLLGAVAGLAQRILSATRPLILVESVASSFSVVLSWGQWENGPTTCMRKAANGQTLRIPGQTGH